MEVDCPETPHERGAGRRRGRSGSRRGEIEAEILVVFFSLVVQGRPRRGRRGDDVARAGSHEKFEPLASRKRPDDEGIAHALDGPRSNLSGGGSSEARRRPRAS